MGWAGGAGRGLGWRRFYSKKEETEILEDEIKDLEEELKGAKERLSELRG
jgi:phosphoenolpyruvate synthase/pyruvate phosphate dikinase